MRGFPPNPKGITAFHSQNLLFKDKTMSRIFSFFCRFNHEVLNLLFAFVGSWKFSSLCSYRVQNRWWIQCDFNDWFRASSLNKTSNKRCNSFRFWTHLWRKSHRFNSKLHHQLCESSNLQATFQTVLTAAHCVYDKTTQKFRSASDFIIVLGNTNRYKNDRNTLSIEASKLVGHSDYNPKTAENDVALIFLKSAVPANHPTAKPIPLSNRTATAGQNCQVSGWGRLRYVSSSSHLT